MSSSITPVERSRLCLEGLSIGDAFGERYFGEPEEALARIAARQLDTSPWRWTDDTAMAKAVAAMLDEHGDIESYGLAKSLLETYQHEPWRGYGGGAHRLFDRLAEGVPWPVAAGSLFDGTGSFGNGAAMRVAPVGAFFADDLDKVVGAARRSAVVTHAHAEGQAGAVAVAVAAAVAWQTRELSIEQTETRLFDEVLARTPSGKTRNGIEEARGTPRTATVTAAASRLGNGSRVSSQDTVPLCLWCVVRSPRNYEEALWTTVQALGDRDTTCAIVGGIVALSAPASTIPALWAKTREPL